MSKRFFVESSTFTLISLMLFQVFHANAQAQQKLTSNAPTFNFSYKISGDREVAPLQAFDDGTKTYLQFRDLTALPLVFSDTPAGKKLLKVGADYDIEPPFVVVRKLESDIFLVMNRRKAFVTYNGPTSVAMTPPPAMFGAKQPMSVSSELAAPVAADAQPKLSTSKASKVHSDRPQPERLAKDESGLANSVVGAPVAAEVKTEAAAADKAAQPTWNLEAGHTIGQELQRWGTAAGWKVIWNMSKDWAVPAQTNFSGDFQSAASEVIKTLAANGAFVHAQFYEGNKTVVVTGSGITGQ